MLEVSGVTRMFSTADYDGVVQGLLNGELDYAWLDCRSTALRRLLQGRTGIHD